MAITVTTGSDEGATSSPRQLIIFGAGDLGREIMYVGMQQHPAFGTPWQTVAFLDDDPGKIGTTLEGLAVIGLDDLKKWPNISRCRFAAGIGNTALRKGTMTRLRERLPSAKAALVVHRSAVVMPTATLADGVYVGCNAIVSIGCDLREHVVVNFNSQIGHDVLIEAYSIVSPGCVLSGRTQIGETSFLGSGVITYPGVKIGPDCTVSADAVVARDLPGNRRLIEKPNAMILPNEG